jgi:peptidoglycan hydrolase-like protein with peptidoglycan-binding domain
MRTTRQKITSVLVGGVAAAVLAGCGGSSTPASQPATQPVSQPLASGQPSQPAAAATSSSSTPSPQDSPQDSPQSATETAETVLRPGSSGPQVLAAQQRLSELGYWVGKSDGEYGNLTVQAVTALQKVAGISRDGVLGPKTRAALDRGVRPEARSSSGHVAEIDLTHQVMLIVDGGKVSTVLNVSTGSGDWYTRPNGTRGHAVTPQGRYTVFRSVDGWDTSPLGQLYRPRYFNGGIAVHGYPSVPPYPASHGCVRVSSPAMDLIWRDDLLAKGARVWVY